MHKRRASDHSEELEFWEAVLRFYEGRCVHVPVFDPEDKNDAFVPLRNERGELVPLLDEQGEPTRDENGEIYPYLVVDNALVRALTSYLPTCRSNSVHWWPQISDRVEGGSIRMTVSKSILDGDRIDVDPRMVRYLRIVDLKEGEPIFRGPDGERLYGPRFSIIQEVPKPNISWSKIVRRALRGKYLDRVRPAGTSVTDVARDVLSKAAETDARLKDIMSNSELTKEAVEGLRKEITRQLTGRLRRSRNMHLPTNAEKLQITPVRGGTGG